MGGEGRQKEERERGREVRRGVRDEKGKRWRRRKGAHLSTDAIGSGALLLVSTPPPRPFRPHSEYPSISDNRSGGFLVRKVRRVRPSSGEERTGGGELSLDRTDCDRVRLPPEDTGTPDLLGSLVLCQAGGSPTSSSPSLVRPSARVMAALLHSSTSRSYQAARIQRQGYVRYTPIVT